MIKMQFITLILIRTQHSIPHYQNQRLKIIIKNANNRYSYIIYIQIFFTFSLLSFLCQSQNWTMQCLPPLYAVINICGRIVEDYPWDTGGRWALLTGQWEKHSVLIPSSTDIQRPISYCASTGLSPPKSNPIWLKLNGS